jgi:choline monooxygenase
VRAFANVCRHRAGPLATHHGRGAKSLRCKYHGWTYGLDGALRGAPEMSATPDFVPSSVCLPALRVEVWHDLVFAAEAGAPPFADVMAGLEAPLGALSPRGFEHHQTVHYDVACNWKVYCDNYLEGYHVPHIHPTLDAVLDYRNYSTEVTPWASWQHSPLSSGDELYGSGEALYYFIYPNTMLNLLPGRLQSNRVIPTGPERCRVEFDYYYLPDPRPEAQRRRAADHDFARHVQDEDAAICEHVQRGLESGHYGTGRLNPLRENAVHAFHELLRAAYRADGA